MIIDSHCHLNPWITDYLPKLIAQAERAGISRFCASCLGTKDYLHYPTRDEIKESNDIVIKGIKKFPDIVYGFCYLNPENKTSLEELKRCRENGISGVKLWIACKASDKKVFPIVEKCIELNIPLLQHSWIKSTGNLPDESSPADVVILAKRYPEAKIIIAHGGGQWEYTLPLIKQFPNIFIDTCGTLPERGMVESAVKELGAKRVIFGSDAPGRQFAVQLQKVLSTKIKEKDKERILSSNFLKLIKE